MKKRIIEVAEVHTSKGCNKALDDGWDLYTVIPDTHNRHGLGNGAKYILVRYAEENRACKCDSPILVRTVIIDGHQLELPVASAALMPLCVGCGGHVAT